MANDNPISMDFYGRVCLDTQRSHAAGDNFWRKRPLALADGKCVADILAFTEIRIKYSVQPAIIHRDAGRDVQANSIKWSITHRNLHGPVGARFLLIERHLHLRGTKGEE